MKVTRSLSYFFAALVFSFITSISTAFAADYPFTLSLVNIQGNLTLYKFSQSSSATVLFNSLPAKVTMLANITPPKGIKTRMTFVLSSVNATTGKKKVVHTQVETGAPFTMYSNVGNNFKGAAFAQGIYEVTATFQSIVKSKKTTLSSSTVKFQYTKSTGNVSAGIPPTPTPTSGGDSDGYANAPSGRCNDSNLHGFTSNRGDFDDESKVAGYLAGQLNANSMRLWHSMERNSDPTSDDFEYAKRLHGQGLKIVMVVTPKKDSGYVPTASEMDSYMRKAVNLAGGSVDYWEIVNEVNKHEYWAGSLNDYMSALKAAAKVLHNAGTYQCVLSTSPTASPGTIATLVGKGMLAYVDGVAFHSYQTTATAELNMVNNVKGQIQGKPLFLTEWNVKHTPSDPDSWAQENEDAYNGKTVGKTFLSIRDLTAGVFFYHDIYMNSPAGFAGPFNPDGSHTKFFTNVQNLFQ